MGVMISYSGKEVFLTVFRDFLQLYEGSSIHQSLRAPPEPRVELPAQSVKGS